MKSLAILILSLLLAGAHSLVLFVEPSYNCVGARSNPRFATMAGTSTTIEPGHFKLRIGYISPAIPSKVINKSGSLLELLFRTLYYTLERDLSETLRPSNSWYVKLIPFSLLDGLMRHFKL